MERQIEVDVHAARCTLAVISGTGRKLEDVPVAADGRAGLGALAPDGRTLVNQAASWSLVTADDDCALAA